MENKSFKNCLGNEVNYLLWAVENPNAVVVISHGMAEHPERYDNLATFFNKNKISVYAIYHIGHGKFAKIKGHMGKGEFDQCVSNLNELVELAHKENKDKKVFLLGHSMGSFISQLYIERYHNIAGVILSGSTAATPIMKMGATVASLVCFFNKDNTKPSPFMDNLSFGSYNKVYDSVKTKFDWLNRDEKEVQKYIDDPECGYICSRMFFKNLTHGLKEMGKKKNTKKVAKDLPIIILGGSMDPVGNCSKGLYALHKQYKKLGIANVSLIVYDGAHHEIFNEINKQEVYDNTLEFINVHL